MKFRFAEIRIMALRRSYEDMATSVVSMSKSQLKRRLKKFKGRFKLDFTDKYLDSVGAERLKHILLAAMVTNTRKRI